MKTKPNALKVLRKTMEQLIKSRCHLLENWIDGDLKWTDPNCEAACHAIEKARDIIEEEFHRIWENDPKIKERFKKALEEWEKGLKDTK